MSVIRPFRAVRPPVALVSEVASVPYDVVNTEEARALAGDNPRSFLHVSRPEIGLPEGTDIYSPQVYETARANYEKLLNDGTLVPEDAPTLYAYQLQMGEQIQTGIAAAYAVDEYDHDTIKKHEKTRPDKEDDRTRHVLTLRAQTGPVFLTYRALDAVDEIVNAATEDAPLYNFTAPDGVRHTVWKIADAEKLVSAFAKVPALYIADGHHRAASASRSRAELRAKNSDHTGDEDYNYFLAVAFPDNQLKILPYNRIVKDLNGLTEDELFARISENFRVSNWGRPTPEQRGQISMYRDGHWYTLTRREDLPEITDPVAALDVSVLQDYLLDPILGIKDVRTDKRIDFVGGIRGTDELENLVNAGKAAVAFSLYPTTVEDLIKVSDAGGIMPPKSTWFEPKLRDAVLIHGI